MPDPLSMMLSIPSQCPESRSADFVEGGGAIPLERVCGECEPNLVAQHFWPLGVPCLDPRSESKRRSSPQTAASKKTKGGHPLDLWNSPVTRRLAGHVHEIIVGTGPCGRAQSRVPGTQGIPQALLERGEMANTRRTDRPDLLQVFIPNRMTRLPGFRVCGNDRDGCMSRLELADFFSKSAGPTPVPLHIRIAATRVPAKGDGHAVATNRGSGAGTPSCSTPARRA
jgi:hypothetical protein